MPRKPSIPTDSSPAAASPVQSKIDDPKSKLTAGQRISARAGSKTAARRSTSSAFAKLPADLRRQVDRAITDRGPGQSTYREIFDKFALADHKLAFRSFQRYAAAVAWSARFRDQRAVMKDIFPEGSAGPSLALLHKTAAAVTSAVLQSILDQDAPPSAQQLYHLALTVATLPRALEAFDDYYRHRNDRLERRARAAAGFPRTSIEALASMMTRWPPFGPHADPPPDAAQRHPAPDDDNNTDSHPPQSSAPSSLAARIDLQCP